MERLEMMKIIEVHLFSQKGHHEMAPRALLLIGLPKLLCLSKVESSNYHCYTEATLG